jgi:hypothetical protein
MTFWSLTHPKEWLRFKIAQFFGFVIYDQPYFVGEKIEAGGWAHVTRNGYIYKSKRPI